jgi:ATP cone domain/LAGLIDADG-like domain
MRMDASLVRFTQSPSPHGHAESLHTVKAVSVRKRDGQTVQPFDPGKITTAISKAWNDCGGCENERELHAITELVATTLPVETVDVEQIQDAVEVALMRHHQFAVAKAYILYRQKRADVRDSRKTPDTTAVSDYIHFDKYAKFREEFSRREVFTETVSRAEEMHLKRFAHVPGLAEDIRWAFDRVREKRLLPSMRSMQFGGEAIIANNNRIYNCSFTMIDRPRAFAEALFLLLCGCGVGFSVQYDHVDKLPSLRVIDENNVVHHTIADTIEGWGDALNALINGYIRGYYVEFNYSQIRPVGSPLKTSGGKAPGHIQLKRALEAIRLVLQGAAGRKLRPIECYDIMCHAADAVLSGGIRRSAMLCLFSLEDAEMMYAKTGNWHSKYPWRQNSNNSVMLKRDEVKKKQFKRIFQMSKEWGEPGFYFTNDYDYGANPCVPAGTRILTREGYVGIETRVEQPTVIWNGIEWCTVTPKVTGHDQPMMRVLLSDGSFLDCTEAHRWCILVGRKEERIPAVALHIGDVLAKYDMPIVEGGADMLHAYSHGFWCGDGTVENNGRKTAMLYGVKKELLSRLAAVRSSEHECVDRIRVVLPKEMPAKNFVPLNASISSRLEWLAGLFDADANVVHNPASPGIQLTSSNLQFLREIRLLLTTLGVQAKISLERDEGERPLPGGHGGMSQFHTQTCYRLLISAADTHRLVTLGLKPGRLDLSFSNEAPQRDARRFVTVTGFESLDRADTVYCFTEDRNHTGTFEGIVTGQCVEIGLDPKLVVNDDTRPLIAKKLGTTEHLEDGQTFSGWAFCNLCEQNAAMFQTFEDFILAAKAATTIATLQAAYTEMPYLGWVSEVIAERDALLGIGMTGMLDAPQVATNPEYQRFVAAQIKRWNAELAARIGIRPAARTTCIKPSGTTSLELGCVASGHHAHHAHRYIRRVTANERQSVFQRFRSVNPHMCVRKPNGDWVVEFPVLAPEWAIVKDDIGAIEFLEMVKSTQVNWVLEGVADARTSPGLTHNVSNTVTVKPHEWDLVADYIWEHRQLFTGVALLAATGDKDFAFAPNEAITTEADEVRWNQLITGYQPVDYTQVVEHEEMPDFAAEAACSAGKCLV